MHRCSQWCQIFEENFILIKILFYKKFYFTSAIKYRENNKVYLQNFSFFLFSNTKAFNTKKRITYIRAHCLIKIIFYNFIILNWLKNLCIDMAKFSRYTFIYHVLFKCHTVKFTFRKKLTIIKNYTPETHNNI